MAARDSGRCVPALCAYPPLDYVVIVSRADRRPIAGVWPISLHDHLPEAPGPLLPPDTDVPLRLQRVFNEGYEQAGCGCWLDTDAPPDPQLNPAQQAWVKERLAAGPSPPAR